MPVSRGVSHGRGAAAPTIAVPGIRIHDVDDDSVGNRHPYQSAELGTFTLPPRRIVDAAVANGPSVTPTARVRYAATEADAEWIQTVKQQLGRSEALLTAGFLESVFTVLELAAFRDPQIPVGRLSLSAEDLRGVGVDLPPTSEVVDRVRQYWAASRTAANRPLIQDLFIWPAADAGPSSSTPFLSRETPVDVWARLHPPSDAPLDTQRQVCFDLLQNYTQDATLLSQAVLAREQRRLDVALAAIYELAAVRAVAALPPTADGSEDDSHEDSDSVVKHALFATDADLERPLTAVEALAALRFGIAQGCEPKNTLDALVADASSSQREGIGVKLESTA